MSEDRVLVLEGVHNFRDFGGYGVAGGGRVKRGKLWRSGQHFGATQADLARISALGLTAIYDLRTDQERSLHPCRRPAEFAGTIHHAASPPPRGSSHQAPHIAGAERKRDAASTRAGLVRTYGAIAFRPELLAIVGRMLADLANGEEAVLVNCMAGKDRTGIAVAAAQLALGVHRDDVIADYLLTNTAGDAEARIQAGIETIRAVTGTVDEEVARVLMGVEAEYLEAAFAAMAERSGSIDDYLAKELGADAAMRERLRERLVES
ncbi:MAG: tyrosine-protein phosphatase [Novosphingobium sp.]